jgi:hypothetical protein
MTRYAFVHRISACAPHDTAALESMLASGAIAAEGLIAILGKTKGNGCVDDYVSGGAERQGPDGGGPVAIIARAPDARRAS